MDPAPGTGGSAPSAGQTQQPAEPRPLLPRRHPLPPRTSGTAKTSPPPAPSAESRLEVDQPGIRRALVGHFGGMARNTKTPLAPSAPISAPSSTRLWAANATGPLRAAFQAACREQRRPRRPPQSVALGQCPMARSSHPRPQRPGETTDKPAQPKSCTPWTAPAMRAPWDGAPLAALLAELPLSELRAADPPNRELAPLYR